MRHRNYRLFFLGQSVSMIGTWMQMVALQWLVYQVALVEMGPQQAALQLGVVAFSSQIMTFLFPPFAGVIIDRWDRRRLIILTQSLATVHAALLAVLTLTGLVTIWRIILLAVFSGLVSAFDITARQSFVVHMVGSREDLPNAIALNSSLVNGARLIGPTIAGVIIVAGDALFRQVGVRNGGPGLCFLCNAVSYLFVIAALLRMDLPPAPRASRAAQGVLQGFAEGLRYAARAVPIRAALLMLAFVSLTGLSYTTLLPVMADQVLHGQAGTLGLLVSSAALGALPAAIFLASRRSVRGLDRFIATAPGVFGLTLLLFSFADRLWLAMPLLAVAGFSVMIQMASTNTVVQTLVEDDKRGRVMSLYTMSFIGMSPFGSLLSGYLASHLGAPVALRLAGAACILAAVVFSWRLPSIRRSTP